MRKIKKRICILCFVLIIGFLFSVSASAAGIIEKDPITRGVGTPRMTVNGSTVTCSSSITAGGSSIDATLVLSQGSTEIASWHKTGTGVVTFSETESIVRGLTYTLTLTGTIDGVPFPTRSITKTL